MKSIKIVNVIQLSLFIFYSNFIPCYSHTSPIPPDFYQDITSFLNSYDINMNQLLDLEESMYLQNDKTIDSLFLIVSNGNFSKNAFYTAKLHYLKLRLKLKRHRPIQIEDIIKELEDLLKQAYLSGNDEIIAFASWNYGDMMFGFQQFDLASTYCQNSLEIYEKNNFGNSLHGYYLRIGETLFHTRDYRKSIYYTLKGLETQPLSETESFQREENIRHLNTVGQNYQQLQILDSALHYYNLSLTLAEELENEIWQGINYSYIGQVQFLLQKYDLSKLYLSKGYQKNKDAEWVIALNSLQWLSKLYLLVEDLDSTAICLNLAGTLYNSNDGRLFLGTSKILEEVYQRKIELFVRTNQVDSAFFYFNHYSKLHDSNEQQATLSSNNVTQLRINYEKKEYALLSVQSQLASYEMVRNRVIAGISLLSIGTIILLLFQYKRMKYERQLSLIQADAIEAEMFAADDKLHLFTKNLLEKAALVKQLEEQIGMMTVASEQQENFLDLSNRKILTDADWTNFKSLFEKTHPRFFMKLNEQAIDISQAELRIAALIRLQLTAREMAAILGVSVDSVHKCRQRLRARLGLSPNVNIKEFLLKL